MILRTEKFLAEDAALLDPSYTQGEILAANSVAMTAFDDEDGAPIAAGGIMHADAHRGIAWFMFPSWFERRYMLTIHREVKAFLDRHQPNPYPRIEMTTLADFQPGCRWARLLGFRAEGRLGHYDEDGNTHILYSRVRTE